MGIVLIEDSPRDALYLSDALARAGYAIDRYASVSELLETIRRRAVSPPSFIIADLFMPDRDGFDLLRELHAGDTKVPILLISGKDSDFLRMAYELGREWGLDMVGVLPKPVNVPVLIGHFRKHGLQPTG